VLREDNQCCHSWQKFSAARPKNYLVKKKLLPLEEDPQKAYIGAFANKHL